MGNFLADILMILHFAFIAFVVLGLFLTILGYFCAWSWIRNLWFRSFHGVAIFFVVLEAWFGVMCPLTVWESELRGSGGPAGYGESFLAYWLHKFIYFDYPTWVFTLGYTVFGGLVALMWFLAPPRSKGFAPKYPEG